MKKILTHLFLAVSLIASTQVSAQYCGSSNVPLDTFISTAYGFGDCNTYSCIVRGRMDTIIIPFTIYQQFTAQGNSVTVYKLQFDSINNLPCGLCWSTSKSLEGSNAVNEFNGGEAGVLRISGMTNDSPGTYLLDLKLNVADAQANDSAINLTNVPSTAGNVYMYIKVINAGAQCPDTINLTTAPLKTASCITNGINTVSQTLNNLSIQPNPVNGEAKITFDSETGGDQQITISDIVGSQVYKTTINARAGYNETTISRNNLPAGIYFLTVGNGQGTATRKFIIAD